MMQILVQAKTDVIIWANSLIPELPFIIAITTPKGRRQWQEHESKKVVSIPSEPGIYLVYPLNSCEPAYIGEASDLCRRVTYHFADSRSSNNESTLKKNIRRDNPSDTFGPLSSSFRIRILPLTFGRKEIEEYLHTTFKLNTRRTIK